MDPTREIAAFRAADAEVFELARSIKLLQIIAWPPAMADEFLEALSAGSPRLPVPPPIAGGFSEQLAAFERLSRPLTDHPIARFIAATARSYQLALRMVENAGAPVYRELSEELYGSTRDAVLPGGLSHLEAAEYFIEATEDLAATVPPTPDAYVYEAEELAAILRQRFAAFFVDDPVAVVVSDELSSKAAAGAEKVTIRSCTRFTRYDLEQLLHHEGFVHTATLINGRRQPHLKCLGLGSPRTTTTQEGLATFAELIEGSIDLARLRRLALRIKAIDMALEGADFLEVFEFFRGAGQLERECYFSAARVFRGGDPRGGVAFTKDAVYLRGLLGTHAFLHAAIAERRPQAIDHLFAGRMSWSDALELGPYFESGLLAGPHYRPRWVADRDALAAFLAFSNLTHKLPVEQVRLADFQSKEAPDVR